MAMHFLPLPNVRLAHLHPKTHICAKFHRNQVKTEEIVYNTKFSIILAHNIIMRLEITMSTHLLSLSKNCVMLTYIVRQTFVMNSMRIG